MSTAFGHIPIVNDGLGFYVDAYSEKSYVSGDTTTNDLVTNEFGKYNFEWVGPSPRVTDSYGSLIFISDDREPRQSIYNTSTDTSYKFSSNELYMGGGQFDETEIVNGLPVVYGGSYSPANINGRNTLYIKRYEYQGNDTWSNTFTKNLTSRLRGSINVDRYNKTNGRSDLWFCETNSPYLSLMQWNGSDYV